MKKEGFSKVWDRMAGDCWKISDLELIIKVLIYWLDSGWLMVNLSKEPLQYNPIDYLINPIELDYEDILLRNISKSPTSDCIIVTWECRKYKDIGGRTHITKNTLEKFWNGETVICDRAKEELKKELSTWADRFLSIAGKFIEKKDRID